jgi:hypothetical protein
MEMNKNKYIIDSLKCIIIIKRRILPETTGFCLIAFPTLQSTGEVPLPLFWLLAAAQQTSSCGPNPCFILRQVVSITITLQI